MTKNFFEESLTNFSNPEILRCPLERIILKTKLSKVGEPLKVLNSCVDNPRAFDLGNAFKNLLDFGAISIPNDLNPSGKVTAIGSMMASMPCDIKLSRILLMGYTFNCFEQVLVICACMNIDRDIFYMRH